MSRTDDFAAAAGYFKSILVNLEVLHIFAQASDFEEITRAHVREKLKAIENQYRPLICSIRAGDAHFKRATCHFARASSPADIALMKEVVGYDSRHFKHESWPDLVEGKLKLFQAHFKDFL